MPELAPGSAVVLNRLPDGLLYDLSPGDQEAIIAIVGRPVLLADYSYGEAELELLDAAGDSHSIWAAATLLRAAD